MFKNFLHFSCGNENYFLHLSKLKREIMRKVFEVISWALYEGKSLAPSETKWN